MKRSFIATALCATFLSISPLSIATAIGHDETEQSGKAERENTYWLGLVADQVGDALRAHLGLGDDVGLLVNDVITGTPAEKAEIQKYDVLVSANGSELKSAADLIKAANESGRSGEEMSLELVRAGKKMNVKAAAIMRPTDSVIGIDISSNPRSKLWEAHWRLSSPVKSSDNLFVEMVELNGSEPEAKSGDAEAAAKAFELHVETHVPMIDARQDDDGNVVISISGPDDEKLNDLPENVKAVLQRVLPQIMKGQNAESGSKVPSAEAPQNDAEENAETSTEKRLHALEAEVARLVEMLGK